MRRVVLFDLDDTLVDRRRALRCWVESFCVRHGVVADAGRWLAGFLRERVTPSHLAQVRDRLGLSGSAEELWAEYRSSMARAVVCPPAVLAGLEVLRAHGWKVGVATNGDADIQWAKLRSTGIADRVDTVCVSGEVGTRKPDPAFFREALRRCGGEGPGGPDAWMVGDNPVKDIEGGRAAGLRTVWVSQGGAWPTGLPEPEHRATDAAAAIRVLRGAVCSGVSAS